MTEEKVSNGYIHKKKQIYMNGVHNSNSIPNNNANALNENEIVLDLESQISELIRNGRSGCHASFRYSYQGPKVMAKLVTWNPKHRSTFLVKEVESLSRVDALQQLFVYVKDK